MVYDIAIIGAGPGGYVGALRAAQQGANVALIEKEHLGGTCLNKGCIPTKAMLASIHCLQYIKEAKNFGVNISDYSIDYETIYERQKKIVKQMGDGLKLLLKSYPNLTIFNGEASLDSHDTISVSGENHQEIQSRNIIISTGSCCADLGPIKADHNLIINSDDALNYSDLPKTMAIVGGGAIGIEWARIYSAFGVDVTIIEMLDRLAPTCDSEISNYLARLFKKEKVKLKTGVRVEEIEKKPEGLIIILNNGEKLSVDKALLAVGRSPNTNIKGLDRIDIDYNGRYIRANDNMQTKVANIYAIGDVVGRLQLAHVASHEAIVAVETILGYKPDPMNYSLVPFCIYGAPEIAAVGLTEEQAKSLNFNIKVYKTLYGANGKATAESQTTGMVKTIIDANNKKILGAHIIGANASDIIHQAVIAIKEGLTQNDFNEIIYAHPTLSESFHESIINLHIPHRK